MRKCLLRIAAAATLAAAAMMPNPARSATLAIAATLCTAAGSISPIEAAACWRHGKRGWGWYPCSHRDGIGPNPSWGKPLVWPPPRYPGSYPPDGRGPNPNWGRL
jgi:hypothetical protein